MISCKLKETLLCSKVKSYLSALYWPPGLLVWAHWHYDVMWSINFGLLVAFWLFVFILMYMHVHKYVLAHTYSYQTKVERGGEMNVWLCVHGGGTSSMQIHITEGHISIKIATKMRRYTWYTHIVALICLHTGLKTYHVRNIQGHYGRLECIIWTDLGHSSTESACMRLTV